MTTMGMGRKSSVIKLVVYGMERIPLELQIVEMGYTMKEKVLWIQMMMENGIQGHRLVSNLIIFGTTKLKKCILDTLPGNLLEKLNWMRLNGAGN